MRRSTPRKKHAGSSKPPSPTRSRFLAALRGGLILNRRQESKRGIRCSPPSLMLVTCSLMSSMKIGLGGKSSRVAVGGTSSFRSRNEWGASAMSFMFEVLYKSPLDMRRELAISESVGRFGGSLTCREEPDDVDLAVGPICLTFEFADRQVAQEAASCLRSQGEHVEGPVDYGSESNVA